MQITQGLVSTVPVFDFVPARPVDASTGEGTTVLLNPSSLPKSGEAAELHSAVNIVSDSDGTGSDLQGRTRRLLPRGESAAERAFTPTHVRRFAFRGDALLIKGMPTDSICHDLHDRDLLHLLAPRLEPQVREDLPLPLQALDGGVTRVLVSPSHSRSSK